MDSILRAAGMYVALMLLFRIAGRRSLADLTTFDFVLLLIMVVDVGRRDAYQHIRRLFDFCIRHILDRYVTWAVVHNCFHVELPESEGRQKSCPTLFRRSLRLECSMRHVLSRISGANQRCYGRCKHA